MLAYAKGSTLVVANAGDVRAVLASNDASRGLVAKPLSTDHNAKHESEQARLTAAHPNEPDVFKCKLHRNSTRVKSCRVRGILQPTRALGDFAFKYEEFNTLHASFQNGGDGFVIPQPYTPPYILADPETQVHTLTDADQFLILGSDGLWGSLSNEEAVEIVANYASRGVHFRAAQALVNRVIAKKVEKKNHTASPIEILWSTIKCQSKTLLRERLAAFMGPRPDGQTRDEFRMAYLEHIADEVIAVPNRAQQADYYIPNEVFYPLFAKKAVMVLRKIASDTNIDEAKWYNTLRECAGTDLVLHIRLSNRTFLVCCLKKRETYEDNLRANARRMGGEWRRSACMWNKQPSEDDYRNRIMDVVGQPATKWTPTKSDIQTYCRALSVDPHGNVTSRLVSFMERVDDVIDENGLRQQLKDPTMLRTFVKVVAAHVTPSYLRDRVDELMKTVPANDLVAFAGILREQLDRTHNKTTKGAALQNMRRWPTKLFETSGNPEKIAHVQQVDTSSQNEVQRYGPRRLKSERGTQQPRSTDRKQIRTQDTMNALPSCV
ncbi:hypothetical protein H257_18875 [Aphanomyces astaci]|uniref:PPM-type phosphatase domain-containing protein n=1 Tax=Aphanomyces astaci TaxID=112090 RepID=W4FBX5_APHAT|nr:hypothetical protein H257_18875 [Aphanomyces astaci]ETV64208.1 hypothetical protein H257_18875 [Aphanomyces astaci]|eukprot:XP_009846308.1 hypothetical protein H257_18875 [Aphanomyces astaci]